MEDFCIVIAEDEALLQRAYARIITRLLTDEGRDGVPILIATIGEQAIELVKEHEAKHGGRTTYMLLTDGTMKGGDLVGPEVVEALDLLLEERLLVRVIVSGEELYKDHADRLSAFFVQKPFDRQDLAPFVSLLFASM